MSKIKDLVETMEVLEKRIDEMETMLDNNSNALAHNDIKILIAGHTYNFPIDVREFIKALDNLTRDELVRVKNEVRKELNIPREASTQRMEDQPKIKVS